MSLIFNFLRLFISTFEKNWIRNRYNFIQKLISRRLGRVQFETIVSCQIYIFENVQEQLYLFSRRHSFIFNRQSLFKGIIFELISFGFSFDRQMGVDDVYYCVRARVIYFLSRSSNRIYSN